jgi:uncharacterized protein YjiS (DUF1127 family)
MILEERRQETEMQALIAAVIRTAKAGLARRYLRQLAALDDHALRDIGLRRTDLFVLEDPRRWACCSLRDVALFIDDATLASCC